MFLSSSHQRQIQPIWQTYQGDKEDRSNLEQTHFASLMRKAALACYAAGIFGILGSLARSNLTNFIVVPLTSGAASGNLGPEVVSEIIQSMNILVPEMYVLIAMSLVFSSFFAFYCFRVGRTYRIGMIQIAGLLWLIWQLAVAPVLLVGYQVLTINWSILSLYEITAQLEAILPLLLLGTVLDLAFLLLFIITFTIGLNMMKTRTRLSLFETAIVVAIVGAVISSVATIFSYIGTNIIIGPFAVLLPIAIIVFGLALSRTGREGSMPRP